MYLVLKLNINIHFIFIRKILDISRSRSHSHKHGGTKNAAKEREMQKGLHEVEEGRSKQKGVFDRKKNTRELCKFKFTYNVNLGNIRIV